MMLILAMILVILLLLSCGLLPSFKCVLMLFPPLSAFLPFKAFLPLSSFLSLPPFFDSKSEEGRIRREKIPQPY